MSPSISTKFESNFAKKFLEIFTEPTTTLTDKKHTIIRKSEVKI